MNAEEIIQKIKEKASEYARTHATNNAKAFYVLGKRDAAITFLSMVRSDGWEAAITDVAKELAKHEPEQEHVKWILQNDTWKSPL